jgi:hypothetical protein
MTGVQHTTRHPVPRTPYRYGVNTGTGSRTAWPCGSRTPYPPQPRTTPYPTRVRGKKSLQITTFAPDPVPRTPKGEAPAGYGVPTPDRPTGAATDATKYRRLGLTGRRPRPQNDAHTARCRR